MKYFLPSLFAGLFLFFGISACDNPAEPQPGPPPTTDANRVHHVGQNYEAIYAGTITYKHGNTIKFATQVGVKVNDEDPTPLMLHVSDGLTIETGAAGAFTLSLNQIPKEAVKVSYPSLAGSGIEVSPPEAVMFTPEDWSPKVVTIASNADEESTSDFTLSASGGIIKDFSRTVMVVKGHVAPRVSVSDDINLRTGTMQFITVSMDRAPGAEVVRLDMQITGATDSITISTNASELFTQSNWHPRVLPISHVGCDDKDRVTVEITATGFLNNQISVNLTHSAGQSEINGSETFVGAVHNFTAMGLVQSIGRFLPTDPLVTPFALSCEITGTAEDRVQFNRTDMVLNQSFDTERCLSLTATAVLSRLE